jgi:hypothetical protein
MEKIQTIGTTRFYIIKGDIKSNILLSKEEVADFVGLIKYPNREHKTRGTKKGDRSFEAVTVITESLLKGSDQLEINAKMLFLQVAEFEGKSRLAEIYPLGYNKQKQTLSHDRIRRSRRAFYRCWCARNGTYTEVQKS